MTITESFINLMRTHKKDIKQKELANKIGMSTAYVNDVMNGRSTMSMSMLEGIRAHYPDLFKQIVGCNPDHLPFGFIDNLKSIRNNLTNLIETMV